MSKYETRDAIVEYMREITGSDSSFANDSLCLYQFSHEIKTGDIVICKGGFTTLIGIGIVDSTYYFEDTDELGRFSNHFNCIVDTYKHRINVEWLAVSHREYGKKLPIKTLTKLKADLAGSLLNLYRDVDIKRLVVPLGNSHSEEEKTKHASSLSESELKELAMLQSTSHPKEVLTTVPKRERKTYIAEYAKRRANGICQLCGKPAPFNRSDGTPYLESHHIEWLSAGGADSVENTVALCPNCHKKMHIVGDPDDIKKLKSVNASLS